jgi:hypothetical protein
MSGSVRKRIRLHVASMVGDVFHLGEAHPTRVLDGRDGKPYANVFFADGEAEYDDLYLQRSARLVVGIHLPWADNTDDDLDDFGDMIEELFVQDSNIDLDNIVAGFVYAGFEYGEPDDSGYIRIYITFNVTY